MKNIFKILVVLLLVNVPHLAQNNDCADVSQYGEGKAPVEMNCVVVDTGLSFFGIDWWVTYYDGAKTCCASVMDCKLTCDRNNETVCHKA